MNHSDKQILIHEAKIIVRALFFSVVTTPAVFLFAIVVLFLMKGSLTGQFISEAQEFTLNAPEGMVMVCQNTETSQSAFPGDISTPQSVLAEPCMKVPVKASEYAAQSDRTLLTVWRVIAAIAFAARMVSWALSDSPSNLSKVKFRRKKW